MRTPEVILCDGTFNADRQKTAVIVLSAVASDFTTFTCCTATTTGETQENFRRVFNALITFAGDSAFAATHLLIGDGSQTLHHVMEELARGQIFGGPHSTPCILTCAFHLLVLNLNDKCKNARRKHALLWVRRWLWRLSALENEQQFNEEWEALRQFVAQNTVTPTTSPASTAAAASTQNDERANHQTTADNCSNAASESDQADNGSDSTSALEQDDDEEIANREIADLEQFLPSDHIEQDLRQRPHSV